MMLRLRARRTRGSVREAGYLLLILMLAVAMITISLMSVALNYRRSIQRDREVEMIHRGVQYERAVRLYVRHNNGTYPPSIDRLLETNGIRYLRKAYKDPMTPDGSWKIATQADLVAAGGRVAPTGLPGAAPLPGTTAGGNTSIFNSPSSGDQGGGQSTAQPAAGSIPAADGSTTPSPDGTSPAGGGDSGSATGNSTGTGSTGDQSAGTAGTTNGPATTPIGGAGPVLGGLGMIGVVSKSKAEGIHEFNGKSHYNQWFFIYDPSQDTGVIGLLLKGPYNPMQSLTAVGGATTGTPATGTPAPGTINPGTPTPGTMGSSPAPSPGTPNP